MTLLEVAPLLRICGGVGEIQGFLGFARNDASTRLRAPDASMAIREKYAIPGFARNDGVS